MNNWKNIILLLCVCSGHVLCQNKSELIETQNKLIEETKLIDSAIKLNEDGQNKSLEELLLINRNIELQSDIINLSKHQLRLLKIEQDSLELRLLKNIDKLSLEKEAYKKLIITASRTELLFSPILFFLSSSSFNHLLRTIYHFRQIELARRQAYNTIKSLQLKIEGQKSQLLKKKSQQASLLISQKEDFESLSIAKQAQKTVINQLKTQKDSLVERLHKRRLEMKKINDSILELIEKENKKNSPFELTPRGRVVSKDFEQNKGRLNWPVKNGIIVSKFGTVPHPILPSISTINNGIEIATSDTNIKSVFKGLVSKILILPNGLKVVIIRHGKYLTVYSNLYEVNVVNGEELNVGDPIGKLYGLQQKQRHNFGFQIWRGREKLNPTKWLSSN
tara:strand:+ start:252 stop:1427 length:1176 start_codon:yes stop_codon:yes gene_type:complete